MSNLLEKKQNFIVYFYEHNARIFYTNNLDLFKNNKDVLINPSLEGLCDDTEFWKKQKGVIVEMNEEEKNERKKYHAQFIQQNPKLFIVPEKEIIKEIEVKEIIQGEVPMLWKAIMILELIIIFVLGYLIKKGR